MKTFVKVILGLIVAVGLGIGAAFYFTSGARDTAREFTMKAVGGQPDAAHALLHTALQDQIPADKFAEMFGGAKPYASVSFSSFEAANGMTTLNGTATTADGCMSKIAFELLGQQITSFDITPLCR